MRDQAATLRLISSKRPPMATMTSSNVTTFADRNTRSIAITAGKGGVGKSNFAVNLALELGALGKKVLLLDADYGLANADLLCGLSPKFHLGHVVSGFKELEDITLELAENVHLVPGGSGIEELANFSMAGRTDIGRKLRALENQHDFLLIDTAAGIGANVIDVLASASELVVIATPEPTAVVDAYATIKVILKYHPQKPISVLVNNVVTLAEANKVFLQIDSAVRNFLGRSIDFLGMVPLDARVQEAVREQIPVVQYAPQSPASRATRLIAKQFCQQNSQNSGLGNKSNNANNIGQSASFWTALTTN